MSALRPPGPPDWLAAAARALLGVDRDGRAVLGDLHEEHAELRSRRGPVRAALWYAGQVLALAPRRAARSTGIQDALLDGRHALRSLRRSPVFTGVLVSTLAVGLGAGAAVFAVVDTLLLRPLPYDAPDELVRIRAADRSTGADGLDLTYADAAALGGANAFSAVAGFSEAPRTVVDDEGRNPESVRVARTHGDLPGLLGVAPVLGRTFTPDEIATGTPVALVSAGLWTRRFGADPDVLGRLLRLESGPLEIVGVLPDPRSYPEGADVWRPLGPGDTEDDDREVHALARLASGVALEAARSRMDALAAEQARAFPESHGTVSLRVDVLRDTLVHDVRTALLAFLGSVGVLLAITLLNTAHLLLTRTSERARDLAVRVSLGAGRMRVARAYLLESLLLGTAGGVAGLIVGRLLLGVLVAAAPGVPLLDTVAVDPRVALVVLATAVGGGALFGLVPALRAASGDPRDLLRRRLRGTTAPGRRGLAASGMVTAEVALSTALVVLSVALAGTLRNVLVHDRGFDPDDLVAFDVDPDHGPESADAWRAWTDGILERVRALPSVEAAGFTSHPVLEQRGLLVDVTVDDGPPPTGTEERATTRIVSAGFFEAAGIPLVEGRTFSSATRDDEPDLVVNERFVRTFLGAGVEPVDRYVRTDWAEGRIVAVVGDVSPSVAEAARPVVYLDLADVALGGSLLLVRARPPVADVAPDVWRAVRSVDDGVLPRETLVLSADIRASVAGERFNLLVVGAFAGISLLLAALGIFGITARSVAARRAEIGIRRALGAPVGRVLREVGAGTAAVLGVGLVAGLGLAQVGRRAVEALLVGVAPTDPAVVGAVLLVLGSVAALAAALPLRSAARVAPTEALKGD